jgi:hypothetical protein
MRVDRSKKSSDKILRGEPVMSIEKKSLISTLKTTKKANIAGAPVAESGKEKVSNQKDLKMRNVGSLRSANMKSLRAQTLKSTKGIK